jgi:hypothetical protein
MFKLYPEGYLVEWWMMHLFSCESSSLELNFCYSSLNLNCGYFLEKAQYPLILGGASYTFALLSKAQRPSFTPDRVTWGVSGR